MDLAQLITIPYHLNYHSIALYNNLMRCDTCGIGDTRPYRRFCIIYIAAVPLYFSDIHLWMHLVRIKFNIISTFVRQPLGPHRHLLRISSTLLPPILFDYLPVLLLLLLRIPDYAILFRYAVASSRRGVVRRRAYRALIRAATFVRMSTRAPHASSPAALRASASLARPPATATISRR